MMCDLEDMIGKPFGATFELVGTKLQRLTPAEVAGDDALLGGEEETRDNRNLMESDSAQQVLTADHLFLNGSSGESSWSTRVLHSQRPTNRVAGLFRLLLSASPCLQRSTP